MSFGEDAVVLVVLDQLALIYLRDTLAEFLQDEHRSQQKKDDVCVWSTTSRNHMPNARRTPTEGIY